MRWFFVDWRQKQQTEVGFDINVFCYFIPFWMWRNAGTWRTFIPPFMWLSGGGLSRQKNQEIPPSLPHINAAELKIQITADGGPEQKKKEMESERWSFLRNFVTESIKKCSFYVAIFSPCFLSIKSVRHGAFRMRERKKTWEKERRRRKKILHSSHIFVSLGSSRKGEKKGGGMATAKEIFSQEREREGTLPGFPGRKKKPKLSSRVSFFVALHMRETAKEERGGFVEKNARR